MRQRLADFFFPESGVVRLAPWMSVAAIGALAALVLSNTDTAQRLEWTTYDRLLRATRRAAPAPGVVIVAIDEPSATELGRQWPWPRDWHARLIDQLADHGARAIVLDIVFEAGGADEAADEALAHAIARAGNVVLASDLVETTSPSYDLAQWVEPFEPLREVAARVGAARVTPDPDGVVRRAALRVEQRMGLALAAAGVAGLAVPEDPDRPRLIGYAGAPRFGVRTVSYYQALEAATLLPRDVFAGQVVFVGRALSLAADLEVPDHYPTPVGLRTAGVEIHANVFDTIARDREVRDPLGTLPRQAAVATALALVAALVLRHVGPGAGIVAVMVGVASLLALAWWALTWSPQIRLPVWPTSIALAAAFTTTSAYRYAIGARERRTIRRAFQHYVSPAVVDLLLRDPSRLKLGGEDCEVTVVFTDLEGFTAMSERLPPEEIRARLSEHFTAMVDALLAEGATLDKFIGDSVMAYFGAPLADANHAAHACAAALAMQRAMAQLTERWESQGLRRVRMRVGINSGRVVAGNMGTASVFNYTVVGDTVNLASRLEGASKAYGTAILAGDGTRASAGDGFVFRELDAIRVQGREQPVAIHELLGRTGEVDPRVLERARVYAEGLDRYRSQNWAGARQAFEALLALDPQDGASLAMLARTIEYEVNPPGPAWDGVYAMRGK
jgi:adenylate cyclase